MQKNSQSERRARANMKIGTRKSRLAMVQTEMAAEAIKKVFPSIEIEIAGFETKGDLHLDKSLSAFGSKGAFTKELEGEIMYMYIINI